MEKETLIDYQTRKIVAKNNDRITRINNPIIEKIKYYNELEEKEKGISNDEMISFIDLQLEILRKEILKTTYDNYKNVIIDEEIFDFLYKIYGNNEEAIKILDDMKKETTKLRR